MGLNFVMGTTGGDREKLVKDIHASSVYAIVAPQMGKQVDFCFLFILQHFLDRRISSHVEIYER